MLISIFGTPSPLTYWTLHAVRVVMARIDPDTGFLQPARFADLEPEQDAINTRSRTNTVFFSDCPESGIGDLFLSLGVPIMLIADEPEDVAAHVAAARALSVEPALRFTSQCICTLSVLSGAPNVWDIRKVHYRVSVRDFVESVLNFFGLEFLNDDKEAIFSQLIAEYAPGGDSTVGEEVVRMIEHACWPGTYSVFDASSQALADNVINQYGGILKSSTVTRLIWPREMFFDGDNPHRFVSGPQSMVGPARALIFGPYLHLPRGNWNARVEIEIDANYSDNQMYGDVLCGGVTVLAAVSAFMPVSGVFAFEMSFTIVEPFNAVEIRCVIQQGAIEGMFLFRKAEITRTDQIAEPPSAVQEMPLRPALNILENPRETRSAYMRMRQEKET